MGDSKSSAKRAVKKLNRRLRNIDFKLEVMQSRYFFNWPERRRLVALRDKLMARKKQLLEFIDE